MQLIITNNEQLKNKHITNKIGRGTNITHMEQMLVLVEYNMERMGHKNVKNYSKYNQINKKIIDWMLQCIVARETFHGTNFTYQKVFDKKIDKYQIIEILIYLIYF
jgi:hypothetical protein